MCAFGADAPNDTPLQPGGLRVGALTAAPYQSVRPASGSSAQLQEVPILTADAAFEAYDVEVVSA